MIGNNTRSQLPGSCEYPQIADHRLTEEL
jgi:hypothetical protein